MHGDNLLGVTGPNPLFWLGSNRFLRFFLPCLVFFAEGDWRAGPSFSGLVFAVETDNKPKRGCSSLASFVLEVAFCWRHVVVGEGGAVRLLVS